MSALDAPDHNEVMEAMARIKKYRNRRPGEVNPTRIQACNAPVPHTYDSQGLIRYGATIVLSNFALGGSVAFDPDENGPGTRPGQFQCTLAPHSDAVARNTFRVLPFGEGNAHESALEAAQSVRDDPDGLGTRPRSLTQRILSVENAEGSESAPKLRYGDQLRLACNDSLLVDPAMPDMLTAPLFLASSFKSEQWGSRIGYKQVVYMTADAGKRNKEAVWTVKKVDLDSDDWGAERYLGLGDPVEAGDTVVLVHQLTGQALHCDQRNVDSTEFGPECEVTAFTATSAAKRSMLENEFNGTCQPETTALVELPPNVWRFQLGSTRAAAHDNRTLPPRMCPQDVVNKLVLLSEGDNENGPLSVVALQKFIGFPFKQGDLKGCNMKRADLFWTLKQFYGGQILPDPQINCLINFLDPDLDMNVELVVLFEVLRKGVATGALQKPPTGVGAERTREALWPSADSRGKISGWDTEQKYMPPGL
mmetsp:Transcript_29598/g.68717  ORF Transcript_29598/g.68717 Transcript_29598/m.68717 type:complete len:478 (-) Transcript_29598:24-1457(-)|eukprot:CAMPEP_0182565766 /NCGR_PEP_ID=MMETSP1324-20130603/7407_1 /TAXON_ID=236786 /ORGANISM="Florenciella sp., Strain RCC1587" /LENGTH=477 /DNA_ID=CAMNT_0024779473 /DNA_START=87 /DNA_END=1520 /DNA_ORIENTATION=+